MNLKLYSRSLRSYASYLFFLAFVEVTSTSTSALAATFQGIPNLDSATALSSNGQYVVGRSNGKGMRWSANAGAIPLYDALGLGVDNPRGVSSDGRTVVGNTNKPAEGAYAPMIWVDGLLYSAPSSVTGSQGVTRWNTTLNAVSDDGFVVVGIEQGQNQPVQGAAQWLEIARTPPYPSFPGLPLHPGYIGDPWPLDSAPPHTTAAFDVSASGNTIVGTAAGAPSIWRPGGSLGALANISNDADLNRISPSGQIAGGTILSGSPSGFIYDIDARSETKIGQLNSRATYVNGISDNKRVVGYGSDGSNSRAFYWDDGLASPIDMKEYLLNQPGLSRPSVLEGWTLTAANDISADGRTIVGTGINPQGQQQAWIADVTKHVVLNFGVAAPGNYGLVPAVSTNLDVIAFDPNLPGLAAAPTPTMADQDRIVAAVQKIFDSSGVKNVEVTTRTTADAVNVYFPIDSPYYAGQSVFGESVTMYNSPTAGQTPGINRFAHASTGNVLVFDASFSNQANGSLEFAAETIAHEVGHALGLMHVDPDGPFIAVEVMDYDDLPDAEEIFTNARTSIVNYGDGSTYPIKHNPLYHLRRYVDGIPDAALTTSHDPALPGEWDQIKAVTIGTDKYRLVGADSPLFDIQLFLGSPGSGGRSFQLLQSIATATVSEIDQLIDGLSVGSSLRLLASSEQGGPRDVALALFDETRVQGVTIPLTGARIRFALARYSPTGNAYEILSTGELSAVPEPSTIVLIFAGVVGGAMRRRRQLA